MNDERQRTVGAFVVVLAAAVVLLLPTVRERFAQSAGVTAVAKRQVMADFSATNADGGTWRLRDHRGEVVAVNFWATWCGPCQQETPVMVRAVRDLAPQGFAVVGVSLDEGDRDAKVKAFAERYAVNYPIVFPEAMSQLSTNLEGIPTTLLIDRQGRVAKRYFGEMRESTLRQDVRTLLAE